MSNLPGAAFRPSSSARFAFASTNLSGGYFPGWGLPCSLLIHQIPIILAIFLSTLPTPPPPSPPPPPQSTKARPHIQWMYFPKLPAVVSGPAEAASKSPVSKPSPGKASAATGLVYPGPQTIVSDPPEPTNDIQTLIQPALKNAPVLEPPLPLPNLVLRADAGLTLPPRPLPPAPKPSVEEQPQPEPPPAQVPSPEPPEPASLSTVVATAPLPLSRAKSPDLIVSPPPRPEVAVKEEAQPEPDNTAAAATRSETTSAQAGPIQQPDASPLAVTQGGSDLDTVVALSPIPSSSDQPFTLPAGEARGRFAIAPKPNLASTEPSPSTLGNTSKPEVVGIEAPSAPPPGKAAAGNPPASVTISFGPGPALKEKTPGTGLAITAAGSGSASAPGKSAFGGITVTGGIEDPGPGNGSSHARPRRPLQTSYGVSVVSTESSGGGLPSFGLFSSHDIHTVYIDVRETENDSDPSWILEVAIAQEPPLPGNTALNIAVGKGLVLPFPAVKKLPAFPPDLIRKHFRKMIIVYGVITAEGKMEQMSVKQTPDPLLNDPVLTSLNQWLFRPAVRNGTAFAVKVLLGIPLWTRDLSTPPKHVSISTTPPS